ncbi:MAG: putative acyl-CoA transferase/carnitine dehydratase [Dehalococcoidia bacterium]|nr:putative acyl-CoA transferase/carnitine dehydratase [Dehalococcoidia bacterium]
MSKQVFEGLKVADFSWAIVGPVVARYLGDHGATVVRVESATRPDIVRASPPFKDKVAGINRSAYYTNYNSSKYSLSLNMDLPQARDVARRLAVWSDVVIESMAPGVIKGWGLGYDDLQTLKPDLIMMSTSNLGQTGPLASMVGFGTQLVSQAGFTHLTGWPDREPAQPYAAYTDMLAPGFGTSALIGALEYRRRTGKGQYLDLSQLEGGLHFLASLFLDYQINGVEARRDGNRSTDAAPHGAYRCRGEDRWCAIAVDSTASWQVFKSQIIGVAWVNDPRFAILQGRKANEDEMDKLVEAWTIEQTAEEVMMRLQAVRVAAGVVKNARDILEDPQLSHRRHYRTLNHPEIGPHTYDYPPFHMSRTPAEIRNAPCLGEHNEFVIKELLGMSDEEYVELLVSGALE